MGFLLSMLNQTFLGLILISQASLLPQAVTPSAFLVKQEAVSSSSRLINEREVFTQKILDLSTRLPSEYGSLVFADNILLALHFLKGDQTSFKLEPEKPFHPTNMNWEKIREPFEVSFVLLPGEVFAFHRNVLPEFQNRVTVTMNSRFYIEEGYKSFAGLGGNGVCHLASLLNWVASSAGLKVEARVNHNFYPIPGVPFLYGTSIRYAEKGYNSQSQNLYIENNFSFPVEFVFEVKEKLVILKVNKLN